MHSQIASLGALLVIGSLAVDPLSQQLVHYKIRTVPGSTGSATLPISSNWEDSSGDRVAYGEGLYMLFMAESDPRTEMLTCDFYLSGS